MLQKDFFLMNCCGIVLGVSIFLSGCGKPKKKDLARKPDKPAAVKASNLVFDSSFEKGKIFKSKLQKNEKAIKKPVGWTSTGQVLNDSSGWVLDEARSGKHSLKIKNIGGSNAYWTGEAIVLKKTANVLETEIWTKAKDMIDKTGTGKLQLIFDVHFKGDNKLEIRKRVFIDIPKTNHDWIKTKKKVLLPGNIIKATPYLSFAGMTGTVWFDDIKVSAYDVLKGKLLFDSNTKVTFTKNAKLLSTESSEKIYQVLGDQEIFSSDFIPVKLNKVYKLSGMFRSKGEKASKLHFGYAAYTKDKKHIIRASVNYVKNTETKLSRKCAKGDSVIYIDSAKNWKKGGQIAFDVDISGEYKDLPNFNLSSAIRNLSKDGELWKIELSKPMSKAYPVGTNIREHMTGGTYIYNAASSKIIPNDWTECSGVILGDKGEYSRIKKLYPRTGYVKVLMLTNYKHPKGIIQFKNIRVQESN